MLLTHEMFFVGKDHDFTAVVQLTSIYIIKILIVIKNILNAQEKLFSTICKYMHEKLNRSQRR